MNAPRILFFIASILLAQTSASAGLVAHYEFEETSGTTLSDSSGNGYDGSIVGSGNLNVYYDADNSGTAFATDTWYHVAFVYDGTTLDLEAIGTASDGIGLIVYVNGVEVDTAGGNLSNGNQTLNTTATNFNLGADGTASNSAFPGILDELRIYNSALSAGEIATLASAGGTLPVIQSFTSS